MNTPENPNQPVHNPLYIRHDIKACEIFDVFTTERGKWDVLENRKKAFYLFLYQLKAKNIENNNAGECFTFNKQNLRSWVLGSVNIGWSLYKNIRQQKYNPDREDFFTSIDWDSKDMIKLHTGRLPSSFIKQSGTKRSYHREPNWNHEKQKKRFQKFLDEKEKERLAMVPVPDRVEYNFDHFRNRTYDNEKVGIRIRSAVIREQYQNDWQAFFKAMGYNPNEGTVRLTSRYRTDIERQKRRFQRFLDEKEKERLAMKPVPEYLIYLPIDFVRRTYAGDNIGQKIYGAVVREIYKKDRQKLFRAVGYDNYAGSIRIELEWEYIETQKYRWQEFLKMKEQERLLMNPKPERIGFNITDVATWAGKPLDWVIRTYHESDLELFFKRMGFDPDTGTVRRIYRQSFPLIYRRDKNITLMVQSIKKHVKNNKYRSPNLIHDKYKKIYRFFRKLRTKDGKIDRGYILTTHIKSPLLISTFRHNDLGISGDKIVFKNMDSKVYKGDDISHDNFGSGMQDIYTLNPEELYIQQEESEEIQQLQEQQLNQYYEALHQCLPEEQDLMKQFSEGKIEIQNMLGV